MKKFKVSEDVVVEALGPNEAEHPLVYLRFEDHPEPQVIPIFSVEIKDLIAALTSAAVWIADQIEQGRDCKAPVDAVSYDVDFR